MSDSEYSVIKNDIIKRFDCIYPLKSDKLSKYTKNFFFINLSCHQDDRRHKENHFAENHIKNPHPFKCYANLFMTCTVPQSVSSLYLSAEGGE